MNPSNVKEDDMDAHIESWFLNGLNRNLEKLRRVVVFFNNIKAEDLDSARQLVFIQIHSFNAAVNTLANQFAGPNRCNEPVLKVSGKILMLGVLENITNDGFLSYLVGIDSFKVSLVDIANVYQRNLTEGEKQAVFDLVSVEIDTIISSDTKHMHSMKLARARKMLDDFLGVKNKSIADAVRESVAKYLQPPAKSV